MRRRRADEAPAGALVSSRATDAIELALTVTPTCDLAPLANLRRVERLRLHGLAPACDLRRLSKITSLTQLVFSGPTEGFSSLAEAPALDSLSCTANTPGLSELANLQRLRLLEMTVERDDLDFSALLASPNLEHLRIQTTPPRRQDSNASHVVRTVNARSRS